MDGVDNVCCNRDWWRLFNLVLANLERMSALMLWSLGCIRCGLVQRLIE